MKRQLYAVVTAGALLCAGPVPADTADVTIYGRLFPQFEYVQTDGATPAGTPVSDLALTPTGQNLPRLHRINSNFSRIGFRGKVDLGGGLKGIWQVQSGARLDTGDGPWANQNSHAGLEGGFGTVFLGNWYPPYRLVGSAVGFLRDISASNLPSTAIILATPGLRSNAATAPSFHRQQHNIIEYWTPALGGVQLLLGYSPDEAKTASKNARLTSAAVKYEAGQLYVALGYEQHDDYFGGSVASGKAAGTSSKDTGVRLSFGLTLGDTEVGLDVERLQYRESGAPTGGFESHRRDAMRFVVQQKLGQTHVAAHLDMADEGECRLVNATCSTAGLGAKQASIGAIHALSKRFDIFTFYTRLINDDSASYTFIRGVTIPGMDESAWVAGIAISL